MPETRDSHGKYSSMYHVIISLFPFQQAMETWLVMQPKTVTSLLKCRVQKTIEKGKNTMCKAIESTSKKNQKIAREYAEYAYKMRTVYHDIFQAYGKPSTAKIRAWDYCKRLCKEMNGHDLIICARNSMKFSACFKFESDGKSCYAYITKDYDRFCYA